MSDTIYKRKECRLCNSQDLLLALPLKPTALADEFLQKTVQKMQPEYPLDLYLCKKCGFAQLTDIVIPQAIYIDYTYETVSSLGLVNHFKKYANEVFDYLNLIPNGLVVDIGSNDGSLLRAFKELGSNVLGVDPAKGIAQKATLSGIETIPEFFTLPLVNKIKSTHGKAKIITANNIYANVDDLQSITIAIRELLDDDGVFVFESFYTLDWIRNMVFDFMYHEHLSYFSVLPLKIFFESLDMELTDVWSTPTKGGSIRCFVQKKNGSRKINPSIQEFIEKEKSFELHNIKTFNSFESEITKKKSDVLDFLNSEILKNKTIAGFGASATTTTMMYHFELSDKISFIVDDYKVKQNTLSPGHHIPVFSPEEIYIKKPDYIYIFAWRYADAIISKHKKYLENGGKFIIPLPELKIISE